MLSELVFSICDICLDSGRVHHVLSRGGNNASHSIDLIIKSNCISLERIDNVEEAVVAVGAIESRIEITDFASVVRDSSHERHLLGFDGYQSLYEIVETG